MKGRNSCFYPQKPATRTQEDFFFPFPCCLVACLCISEPGVEWLRGLRKPRKSLMSERIISVYESSSDFPQIPFHSGKKWIFSARGEKKTFNATWQAKHPVCGERFEHTLRIELMPYVLPALSCSLSTHNGKPPLTLGLLYRGSHEGTVRAVMQCKFSTVCRGNELISMAHHLILGCELRRKHH